MSKVFISYVNRNRKVAEGLCAYLEGHGIPCWMAPRDISSGFYAAEITRAIKSADVFLVVCSKDTSQSDHVKNEVNLAVNHGGLILPYCLDDSPFDDALEYYLGSKHRIISAGKQEDDFRRIEHIIREYRGEAELQPTVAETQSKRFPWRLLAPVLCVLAVLAGLFIYFQNRPAVEDETPVTNPAEQTDTLVLPTISQTEPSKPAATSADRQTVVEVKIDPNADTFTGEITPEGYPNGAGTYTFKKARRIDMHDSKARMAEVGDFIDGYWAKGHLISGEWYGANGTMKEYIDLGNYPDVEKDQALGTCVKP